MSLSTLITVLGCLVLCTAYQGVDATSILLTPSQKHPEVFIRQESQKELVANVANATFAEPPLTTPLLMAALTLANAGVLVIVPMLLILMWKAPNLQGIPLRPDQDAEDQSIGKSLMSVIVWASLGSVCVCFNKYVILPVNEGGFGFPCPMALTWWHMCTGVIGTCAIRLFYPSLMPAVQEGKMTLHGFLTGVVPVGFLFAAYLALGNVSYMYLSVPYIQMLKNAGPLFVFGVAVVFGMEKFTRATVMPICIVVVGVAAATVGEGAFNVFGFMLQFVAFLIDALRLVLIKKLLSSHGTKLDPLSGLYYYCPVCIVLLLWPVAHFEGNMVSDVLRHASPSLLCMLVLNGLVAFSVNISLLSVLAHTSATTLTMASVVRNVLLTFGSAMLFHNSITPGQILGYFSACVGVKLWDEVKARPALFNNLNKSELMSMLRTASQQASHPAKLPESKPTRQPAGQPTM